MPARPRIVTTDSNRVSDRVRGLWRWAVGGLVGPALVWAAANWGSETRLPLGGALTFLYPMWVFGWLVMGLHSSVLGPKQACFETT